MRSTPKMGAFSKTARLGAGLTLLAAFLALGAPPIGHEHGKLAQFVGRFHPLIVHLPIGLLVLVPILELAGAFGRGIELRSTAGFVLGLATAGVIAAALDGWLLAWSGGYGGPLVTRHMWSGVALAALCVVASVVRKASPPGRPGYILAYCPLLISTVALMVWTGHAGGQLSHGESFLTEFMPSRLRSILGVPEPARPKPPPPAKAGAVPTLYAARIAPIFARSCASCHNPNKMKGGLRLDSYAQLMLGGDDGSVVDPWYPQYSELIRRVTLPPDDDDYMPSNGKNPLTPDQIRLLERWIGAGAAAQEPRDAAPSGGPAAQ